MPTLDVSEYDTLIVGGGITGAFCAYFLAGRGQRVALVDPGQATAKASCRNPGGINPLHGPGIPGFMQAFAMDAYNIHASHHQRISQLAGFESSYRRVQRYEVAFTSDQVLSLEKQNRLYNDTNGFSAAFIEPTELLELDPFANPRICAALLLEGNAQVDGYRYTEAVLAAAQQLGATLLIGSVRGLQRDGDYLQSVVLADQQVSADQIVLAAGAWTGRLTAMLETPLPVEPVRGDLLRIRHPQRRASHHLTCGPSGIYATDSGDILIGGTQESVGFDDSASETSREKLWVQAEQLVPEIRSADLLEQVIGFRPTTPDLQPIVGPIPGLRNVHVASGGWSKGMLLAPAMALSVCDAIAPVDGRTRHAHPEQLNVQRFL